MVPGTSPQKSQRNGRHHDGDHFIPQRDTDNLTGKSATNKNRPFHIRNNKKSFCLLFRHKNPDQRPDSVSIALKKA
jgi:hypothetical protein